MQPRSAGRAPRRGIAAALFAALALSVFALPGATGTGQSSLKHEATIAWAKAEIENLVSSDDRASSLSIALVDAEGFLWTESFGFLDRKNGVKPGPETRFGLASGSKMFAALATMILADRGLVDLDAPLARYVPRFRMLEGEPYGAITVRMLLSHSSGLPGSDYRNGTTYSPVRDHALQILDGLAGMRLKHQPGEMAMYCNDGFSLAELLVESVSGISYGDFVRKEILAPLGMSESALGTETLEKGTYATSLDGEGLPYPQEYINVLGTGGIYSTAGDLGRLAMMFLGKGSLGSAKILSEAAIAEMGENQSARLRYNPFDINNFGLGWDSVGEPWGDDVKMRIWNKNGGSVYFSTQFEIAPDSGFGLVILAAGAKFDIEIFAKRILASLLSENAIMSALPEPTLPPLPAPMPAATANATTVAKSLVGYYAGSTLHRLEKNGETLTISVPYMERWYPTNAGILARSTGEWISDAVPETALFGFSLMDRQYLASRNRGAPPIGGGVSILGVKLDPLAAPLSEAWKARLGQRWLIANDPFSTFVALGISPPGFSIREERDLPGYLVAAPWSSFENALDPSGSDARAKMLGDLGGRDLADLVIKTMDGEEWIEWGTSLYRPLASIPALGYGAWILDSRPENLGEWRRISEDSKVEVSGAASWYLYDGEFSLLHSVVKGTAIRGGENALAPAGSYLLVYGEPEGKSAVKLVSR
jgi:CubicO group peptidase (beta-lactamase class C family)